MAFMLRQFTDKTKSLKMSVMSFIKYMKNKIFRKKNQQSFLPGVYEKCRRIFLHWLISQT